MGQLGSIAVTVSIATERYLTVCYPTSHFSRKYLLTLLPILISIIYNIPKFFEIVRCSDNEMYLNMLKSYYKDNINNTITRRQGEDMVTVPSENDIHPSSAAPNQTILQINSTSKHEELFKEHMQGDRFSNETNIERDMINFVMTTHQKQVIEALNDNVQLCDFYGHRAANFRNNYWYIILYHFISDLFLVKIIPWLLVIAFNTKVYMATRNFRRMRQHLLNRDQSERCKLIIH